jgi:hypothetical protein
MAENTSSSLPDSVNILPCMYFRKQSPCPSTILVCKEQPNTQKLTQEYRWQHLLNLKQRYPQRVHLLISTSDVFAIKIANALRGEERKLKKEKRKYADLKTMGPSSTTF